jgi:predicted TIM-barrel fold metal-dependent hydrolase
MSDAPNGFPPFEAATRHPDPPAGPGSCDAQVHVFSPDTQRYPPAQKRIYDPPLGSMDDALRMHRALGMDRGVVVQATIYGSDNRLMADSIAGRANYRGIAIVDDSVSDGELERLHAAGVRGARFNFAAFLGLVPTADEFRRSIRRITELGWHARVHTSGDELLEIEGLLREVTCPIVIDHMAHLEFGRGLQQPAMLLALDLLRGENWWVMLSSGDRSSTQERGWTDAVPFGRRFFEAAPDRAIWCTDWPHVRYRKPMVNDGDLVELLYRFVPEPELRRKVLADNPARLMGFEE